MNKQEAKSILIYQLGFISDDTSFEQQQFSRALEIAIEALEEDISIENLAEITDELQRFADTLTRREKLLEEMKQVEDKMLVGVCKLRFIGANGSMGLTHGKVYDVDVGYNPLTEDFYVEWNVCGVGKRRCPYYSMQRLLENWERPGEDVNIKNQSVKDLHAEAVTKTQQLDIQEIINDAMEKKDRYVSILVTNEGHMSVNVYPSEEEDYVEEEESRSKKDSVRRKKLYQYNYPF